uniref:Uncharacterized protein n=1 Tax=Arundo donax TaxID=35708 RepID=A0A0A9E5C3_ARUDO
MFSAEGRSNTVLSSTEGFSDPADNAAICELSLSWLAITSFISVDGFPDTNLNISFKTK